MTRYALVAVLVLTGSCAVPAPQPEISTLGPAFERLLIGTSTRAEAQAALGRAIVVDFDSGYEVWVYREQLRDQPAAEFVLLFEPSGILKKKRRKQGQTPFPLK